MYIGLKMGERKKLIKWKTHCGLGSLTEAIMAGVPIVTLPFSMDQPALLHIVSQ
jgi:hypothetical protein